MVLRGRWVMRSWLWAIVLCLTGCGYQLAKLTPTRIDTQDTQLLSTWHHSFQSNTDASNAIVVHDVKFVRHELFGATSEVLLSLEAQVRYPNGTTQHFVATERYPYQKTASTDHEFEPARARLYETLAHQIAQGNATNQATNP